ncbi:probable ribonuclease ZC3H12D [Sitophilus oryzae]|uniref:Probable ribonuclease ZC3H12D n=1 Tax=Sitophilus oryzae TaxID=7048 RepID=A0A6J2Y024_SITOR|nr:probable ribonuclease ZC3H12D [Sitophilus oryzae]
MVKDDDKLLEEKEKLKRHILKMLKDNSQRSRIGKKRKMDNSDEPKTKRMRLKDTKEETTDDEASTSIEENIQKYGKNFYCPKITKKKSGLRPVYIDGSNVAYCHGENEKFSVKGIQICVDYFLNRGHEVKAFVPHYRLRKGESSDPALLQELVDSKLVITTPTLYIEEQQRSPYDDWYIVQAAAANEGIVVSRDNFNDIIRWNPNLKTVVEQRRLVPTFVGDMLIFPVDPHGNRKNNLDQFLKY